MASSAWNIFLGRVYRRKKINRERCLDAVGPLLAVKVEIARESIFSPGIAIGMGGQHH